MKKTNCSDGVQCRGNNSSGACHCRMYSADSSADCGVSDLHSDQWKYGAGDSNRKSGLY